MQYLENDVLKITVHRKGAEMISVYHKGLQREMLWHGDDAHWGQSSPHLFPIVGKVFNNQYQVDGTTYELPQHGFLRRQDLDLVKRSETQLVYRFDSNDETLKIYPYHHAVEVSYTLKGNRVEVQWKVINKDDKKMYYSIGAHPGFVIDKTHDYVVEYESTKANQKVVLGNGYLESIEPVQIEPLVINEDTFVNDAVMYTGVDACSLVDLTTGHRIRCDFKGFEYIAVWSSLKSGSMAPFVCLEPWRGILDDFGGFNDISEKRGIQSVEVGCESVNTYGLEF